MTTSTPRLRALVVLAFALFLAFVSILLAQDPTPPPGPRTVLIQEIEELAARHAREGGPNASTQSLDEKFGARARDLELTMTEVLAIYERAFENARPEPSLWATLLGTGGWPLALLLFIAFVFKEALQTAFGSIFARVMNWALARLSTHRVLLRGALGRYRSFLDTKYEQFEALVKPAKRLEMGRSYVPLQVSVDGQDGEFEASDAVARYERLVVLGPPGCGKTMLLRHIALSYTEGALEELPKRPIPILLDLGDWAKLDEPLADSLAAVLKQSGFHKAGEFVEVGLEDGNLMILLDGLDEIGQASRARMASEIRSLLRSAPKCRVIVTCRKAAYKKEFAHDIETTLEIAPFNDRQIRDYLHSWRDDMPRGKSVDQLIQALRSRPHIMKLARNPQLLSIMAWLYTTQPGFVLPQSRSEFYHQAADALLRKGEGRGNQYTPGEKRAVLRHLALSNQDDDQDRQDRRSMKLSAVISCVKAVLPEIGQPAENAAPLLHETVDRSGLLLSLEGGGRYQFAHLTLQGFFAAEALKDDPDALLKRFTSDPETWGETVKLWCGLDHDSTDFIMRLNDEDHIAALECLACAHEMNEDRAEDIAWQFLEELGGAGDSGEAINEAFASLASGPHPLATRAFKALEDILILDEDPARRAAATSALALTNLPGAATTLGRYFDNRQIRDEARRALVRMGDLAVPVLEGLAREGHPEALADLQRIETPQAAVAIVPFLWSEKERIAQRAAMAIAAIMHLPAVEAELSVYPLTPHQRADSPPEWISVGFDRRPISPRRGPFEWLSRVFGRARESLVRRPSEALLTIAGRTARLIDQAMEDPEAQPIANLDPRIIAPLAVKAQDAIQAATSTAARGTRLDRLLRCLDTPKMIKLRGCLFGQPRPTMEDWMTIRRKFKAEFRSSWNYQIILMLMLLISLGALVEIGVTLSQSTGTIAWRHGALIYAAIAIVACWHLGWNGPRYELGEEPLAPKWASLVFLGLAYPFDIAREVVDVLLHPNRPPEINYGPRRYVWAVPAFSPAVLFYSTLFLGKCFSSRGAVLFWFIAAPFAALLIWSGLSRERRARNPLHDILPWLD